MITVALTIRVLIVDDDASLRSLLHHILELSQAFEVVGTAEDGVEAIEKVTSLQPDLVLLDSVMPRLDGLEAIPKIREVSPSSQIVIFSGFPHDQVADEMLRLGAVGYLQKGAQTVDQLLQLLEKMLDGPQFSHQLGRANEQSVP